MFNTLTKNSKGQVGTLVALVVGMIVSMILLIGVLSPVTTSVVNSVNFTPPNTVNGTTLGFTGVNLTLAQNFQTFILLGALCIVAGVFVLRFVNS